MKKIYLRNCYSKNEFFEIKKIDLSYFEEYKSKIIGEISLPNEKYLFFISNLRLSYSFLEKFKNDSQTYDGVATCVKISNKDTNEHCFVILNGHTYPRYVSF